VGFLSIPLSIAANLFIISNSWSNNIHEVNIGAMVDENIVSIEEQGIDLKKWSRLFIGNWPVFALCLALALAGSMVFIMLSPPQYLLRTNILVNKDNNPLDKAQAFTSAFYNDPYQLENEKGVLRAKTVTQKTIRQLDFTTAYSLKRKFNRVELYNESPIAVDKDTSHLQPVGIYFSVRLLNDSLLEVKSEGEDVVLYDFSKNEVNTKIPEFHFADTVKFGEITGNAYCRFSILPGFENLGDENLKKTYYFRFFTQRELVGAFRRFDVETNRGSSIIAVTFRYENPQKAADFLNKLTSEYLKRGVERDNKIASATIFFIDSQLGDIVDSLHLSGEQLQDFRSSKKVMNIDYQADKVYSKLEALEADKAKLLVKKRYFNYLIQNLHSKTEMNELVSPSTMEINDPLLNNLIIELAELYSERLELSFNSIKDNPYLNSLDLKISDTRGKLLDAARGNKEATDIAIEETENQIIEAESTLNRLPKDQQQLLSIERKFKLNDELYTYLLTRRSEMEIFKASNIPENEILDAAEADDAQLVSPNIRLNLIMALILGLMIPGVILYFRETMNNRIRTREDILRFTQHPLVGQVIDSKYTNFPAVLKEPNSVLTESYRTLRTNLQFIIDESVSNTLLVTSAVQGEGKSFTALNLASVYAFYGKRTILVDFDLRKSKIRENLTITANKGLSNYLSKNCTIDDIIYTSESINFDLILSGPVPPNPSELVASPLTIQLFSHLKQRYDIIIIDSPPLGIVSDALLIYPHCDISLLVVRYNYTSLEVFENVVIDLNARNIKKVNIILNDVSMPKSKYGYGYGYGYGYKSEEQKRSTSWFKKKFWNS
jgi:tyrosine-protein kinase Etk/Wzc